MTAADPIERFCASLESARRDESFDPTRAALATVDEQGAPAVRFVLIKQVDRRGFVFFTDLRGPKARDVQRTCRAALAFHWSSISEQVRVTGDVEAVGGHESDAYFATRPHGSQIAAWCSRQSEPIADRATLEDAYRQCERRFESRVVPRPEHWGGYRIVPERIEFWQGRDNRLHDRLLYTRAAEGQWSVQRLQP